LKTLIIGIGNPGRTDDGLGPVLAETVENWKIPEVTTTIDYQLNIEHAGEIAEADLVIFIDASVNVSPPFSFYRVHPAAENEYTTHAMKPEAVLAACREVYGKLPPAYILAVRGDNFDFGENLSPEASGYLKEAQRFLAELLKPGDLQARCGEAALGCNRL